MARRESLNPCFICNMTTGSREDIEKKMGQLRGGAQLLECWKLDVDNVVTVKLPSPAHYKQGSLSAGKVEPGLSLLFSELRSSWDA